MVLGIRALLMETPANHERSDPNVTSLTEWSGQHKNCRKKVGKEGKNVDDQHR